MIISFIGIGTLIGRLLMGALGDRFSTADLFSISSVINGASIIPFGLDISYPIMCFFAMTFGFGGGGYIALCPLLIVEFFGVNDMAKAIGLIYTFTAFFSLLMPGIVGALYDALGSFFVAFFVAGILSVGGGLFLKFQTYGMERRKKKKEKKTSTEVMQQQEQEKDYELGNKKSGVMIMDRVRV